ncbi:MAG: methyltransferase [Acidimicrobiaceae bacterium]|nr:MAG: methyltransferase [Acidimicrobiaceae bacterium]
MPAAVYDASAEGYVRFVGVEISAATEGPVDRSLLGAFVELMADAPAGRVADLGCGPGRVAAFLAAHEFDVFGVDVSGVMVVAARNALEQGKLTALPIADASLAGAVCWYSIIYTPPEHLDDVCLELSRVLAPGGYLLVAFQAGQGEGVHQANAHGTNLPLTSYRHDPEVVIRTLSGTGLKVHLRAVREPQFTHESSPQAFIIARAEPCQP